MTIDYSKYSNYELVELYYRIDKKRNADNIILLERQIRENLQIPHSKNLNDPDIQQIFKNILYDDDPKNYNKFTLTTSFKKSNNYVESLIYVALLTMILSYYFNLMPLEIPIFIASIAGYAKLIYGFKNKATIYAGITLIESREPNKFLFYQTIVFIFSTLSLVLFVYLKVK
jgi:hypothetical protein